MRFKLDYALLPQRVTLSVESKFTSLAYISGYFLIRKSYGARFTMTQLELGRVSGALLCTL